MNFYSLNNKAPKVSFKDAVIAGIAPDKGLYFPESITPLPDSFFEDIGNLSHTEIAFQAIHQFVTDDIPDSVLQDILKEVLDFDFPVVEIEQNIATLELFHGPTMAFKDVGARFMAQCLGYFSQKEPQANRLKPQSSQKIQSPGEESLATESNSDPLQVTVLVATSGDTGGAVANGFLGVEGVKVVILYPSGKVSDIQERQLTTLGQNITALQVDGTFDDCQKMVKTAFLDEELLAEMQLTSANSINVARWLPQLFYFLFAYKQVQELEIQKESQNSAKSKDGQIESNDDHGGLKESSSKSKAKPIIFSIPSGNFGNICAGMVAQRLGLPVEHFVAATNVNDTVPEFMLTGQYNPKPSTATISNAMDVGDPSNFIRIRHLYRDDFESLKNNLSSYSFTDDETRKAILDIYESSGYVADPHGAVGYLGLKKHLEHFSDRGDSTNRSTPYGIFLETAHPVKFLDVVEETIGKSIPIPAQIRKVMDKEKKSVPIKGYGQLKKYLLKN
ncbi:MAG: threonine synthase [Pricia sp.]